MLQKKKIREGLQSSIKRKTKQNKRASVDHIALLFLSGSYYMLLYLGFFSVTDKDQFNFPKLSLYLTAHIHSHRKSEGEKWIFKKKKWAEPSFQRECTFFLLLKGGAVCFPDFLQHCMTKKISAKLLNVRKKYKVNNAHCTSPRDLCTEKHRGRGPGCCFVHVWAISSHSSNFQTVQLYLKAFLSCVEGQSRGFTLALPSAIHSCLRATKMST